MKAGKIGKIMGGKIIRKIITLAGLGLAGEAVEGGAVGGGKGDDDGGVGYQADGGHGRPDDGRGEAEGLLKIENGWTRRP